MHIEKSLIWNSWFCDTNTCFVTKLDANGRWRRPAYCTPSETTGPCLLCVSSAYRITYSIGSAGSRRTSPGTKAVIKGRRDPFSLTLSADLLQRATRIVRRRTVFIDMLLSGSSVLYKNSDKNDGSPVLNTHSARTFVPGRTCGRFDKETVMNIKSWFYAQNCAFFDVFGLSST